MAAERSESAQVGWSMRLPGSWCRTFAVRDDSGEVVAVDEDGWIKSYERMDLDDRNDLVYLANDALRVRRRTDWRARLARRLLRVPFSPYVRSHFGAAEMGRTEATDGR
jgi:hypothetical protein